MVQANVVDFVPVEKENPFTDFISQLASAGEGKAAQIQLDPGDKVGPILKLIRTAANAAGYTARLQSKDIADDGSGTVVLTLGAKMDHPGRAGAKGKK